jgi:hypothetical protein
MLSHHVSVVPMVIAMSVQAPAGQKSAAPEAAAEAGWTSLFNGNETQTISWTQPADWTGGARRSGAHDANSVGYYKNIRIKPLT